MYFLHHQFEELYFLDYLDQEMENQYLGHLHLTHLEQEYLEHLETQYNHRLLHHLLMLYLKKLNLNLLLHIPMEFLLHHYQL